MNSIKCMAMDLTRDFNRSFLFAANREINFPYILARSAPTRKTVHLEDILLDRSHRIPTLAIGFGLGQQFQGFSSVPVIAKSYLTLMIAYILCNFSKGAIQ